MIYFTISFFIAFLQILFEIMANLPNIPCTHTIRNMAKWISRIKNEKYFEEIRLMSIKIQCSFCVCTYSTCTCVIVIRYINLCSSLT